MIIGTVQVSEEILALKAKDPEVFKQYCRSLVPEEYRHVQAIVDNQIYYCCLLLRASKQISWDEKRNLLNKVMWDLKITGFTGSLIEAKSLLDYANVQRVKAFAIKR